MAISNNQKLRLKNSLIFFGVFVMLAVNFIFLVVFYLAYFSGYKVLLLVNEIGEAHVEFIVLLVCFLISCWSLYQLKDSIFKKSMEANHGSHS